MKISIPSSSFFNSTRLISYFYDVIAQEEYKEKGRFLYGESMGGAVALLLHKKDPSFWNGALLVAPMCKVTFLLISIIETLYLIKLRHKIY
jgi:alpha-beta hydrolase superfamily lysophospholipase